MKRGSRKNRLLDAWFGIPALNALASLRSRRRFPERVERIGLMCSFALGDSLLCSAAIRSVRERYPEQRLIFFYGPQNAAAARLIPGIDELVAINLLKPAMSIRRMRGARLDLLLDFSSWQRLTALYSILSGAKFTVGFRTPGQWRHRGYDLIVDHSNERHEVDNFRALHCAIGIDMRSPPTLTPPVVVLASELVEARHPIVFHLWPSGLRSETREWPEERWVELAVRLAAEYGPGTKFLLTGSPADYARSQAAAAALRAAGIDAAPFAGHDGFAGLCQLLLKAELVVSVNTGVMHLAAILGVPTVSLNGPTSNLRWGPVGPCAIGVQPEGGGCGYLNLGFEFRNQPTDCMERISVEMVQNAIRLLGCGDRRSQSEVPCTRQ